MNFKLSKQQRLRTPDDFRRVYQSKQWGGSTHHTFNVLKGEGQSSLGVTVSKKVSKHAVQRNRIKRQIREFYRLRQSQLMSGVQVVITAKPSCGRADDSDRASSIELLWSKLLKWQRWHQHTSKQQDFQA